MFDRGHEVHAVLAARLAADDNQPSSAVQARCIGGENDNDLRKRPPIGHEIDELDALRVAARHRVFVCGQDLPHRRGRQRPVVGRDFPRGGRRRRQEEGTERQSSRMRGQA